MEELSGSGSSSARIETSPPKAVTPPPAPPVVEPVETAPAPPIAAAPEAKPAETTRQTAAAPVPEVPVPAPVEASSASAVAAAPASAGPETTVALSLSQIRDAWPEILEKVQNTKLNAWMVLQTAQARDLKGDILTVTFVSQNDVDQFKSGGITGVSEYLRNAIVEVLGTRVKFIAKVETPLSESPPDDLPEPPEPDVEPGGWAVAAIPASEPVDEKPAPRQRPVASVAPTTPNDNRYGESVVREILNASFIEEQPHVPRVIPRGDD